MENLGFFDIPIDEAETEGLSQAETTQGAVPAVARPAKNAKITNLQRARNDDDAARKWHAIRTASEGTPNATERKRLAA